MGQSGLVKWTKQLNDEIPKYKKDLELQDQKPKAMGKKNIETLEKEYKVAKALIEKGDELTSLQQSAWEMIHEKKTISVNEPPAEYWKEEQRIRNRSIGVCGSCRWGSGCLRCRVDKLTSYWMRREHKRTGRAIDDQYKL